MKEKNIISGRVWVLAEEKRLIEDIDTDQIYHNAYLHITDIGEMGQYALGNLKGWEDFPSRAEPGDILAAGRNFGAGSSRQQAVDCFAALGVASILAPSFGAIYFRNAVNSGFPLLRCTELSDWIQDGKLENGDRIEIDLRTGKGKNFTKGSVLETEGMSRVQAAVYEAGGLFAYGKAIESDGVK
jgi:3-isopropylmalate/(R)-2-methylmalate dehydratase small subunit